MHAVTIGRRSFITGFRLAGVLGIEVNTPEETLNEITNFLNDKNVSLIIISEDVDKPIHDQITLIRSKHPIPLIYEIPGPGSKREKVEYRSLIKSILKI